MMGKKMKITKMEEVWWDQNIIFRDDELLYGYEYMISYYLNIFTISQSFKTIFFSKM